MKFFTATSFLTIASLPALCSGFILSDSTLSALNSSIAQFKLEHDSPDFASSLNATIFTAIDNFRKTLKGEKTTKLDDTFSKDFIKAVSGPVKNKALTLSTLREALSSIGVKVNRKRSVSSRTDLILSKRSVWGQISRTAGQVAHRIGNIIVGLPEMVFGAIMTVLVAFLEIAAAAGCGFGSSCQAMGGTSQAAAEPWDNPLQYMAYLTVDGFDRIFLGHGAGPFSSSSNDN